MTKELRKGLAIDEYLELIKEDKNLNMAYISLSQYMHLLENQLEEKQKVIDKILQSIRKCKMLMPHEFDWEEQVENIEKVLERDKNESKKL